MAPGGIPLKVRDIVATLDGILMTGEDLLDVDIQAAAAPT